MCLFKFIPKTRGPMKPKFMWNHIRICESSIRAGLAPFQDGRHSSKMAAMAPIQDGVQAQLGATTRRPGDAFGGELTP